MSEMLLRTPALPCSKPTSMPRSNDMTSGTSRYDRSLVGAPKEGESANGLHMIHGHYSAQQNIAEKGNGGEFTFAQVMAANATLSVAEFSKVRHSSDCVCECWFVGVAAALFALDSICSS